jgi:2-methylaconitate cis-trans-isomerase PrpF
MEQVGIRVSIVRGGTSKAVFVREEDMPFAAGQHRDALIRAVFGSPDRRQIDGLGGADLLTSKFALIGPPSRPDADVDYTFAQVGIEIPTVAWDLNCGNISSAVGPYAIEEGYVEATEPMTVVRIHNTNTGKIIRAEVQVEGGAPRVEGDFAIDGVPGTGSRIDLDFSDTAGSATGKLLPTGNPVDVLDVPGIGKVEASIVDAANPGVYIAAETVGLAGNADPVAIEENAEVMTALERIRCEGAVAAGMATNAATATVDCPTQPFIVTLGPPQDWADFETRATRPASSADFVARFVMMQRVHKAYAGTGTICTGAAAMIPGTLVNRFGGFGDTGSGTVRIGHPSGVIEVEVEVGAGPELKRAAISRTARRLLDGKALVRASVLEGAASELQLA